MLRRLLLIVSVVLSVATTATAQPAPQPNTVDLEFERTDLGVWSPPAGWVSDDILMLGVPEGERVADAKLWFWSRERGIFSQDIPEGAEGIAESGCAVPGAIIWLTRQRQGNNRTRSYLRRLEFVDGEWRPNAELFSRIDAGSEIVDRHFTIPVSPALPERGVFFARGACQLVSTDTFRRVLARTPSLGVGTHVQFTAYRDGSWRAAPLQLRRIADNAVSLESLEGRPYVAFDANFEQIGEGQGDLYTLDFQTPVGRYAFHPERRMVGVLLADGRLWRTALSHPTPDGCIVFQATHHPSNVVMVSGPFSTSFPKYRYHMIDLCSPANQAIFAASQ